MTVPDMTLSRTTLATLTEYAVQARLYADEIALTHPQTYAAAEAHGEARGWKLALILMGGTMPDLGGDA